MNKWSMHVVCMLECMTYLFIYVGFKRGDLTPPGTIYSYTLHKTDFCKYFHIFLLFPVFPDMWKSLNTPDRHSLVFLEQTFFCKK